MIRFTERICRPLLALVVLLALPGVAAASASASGSNADADDEPAFTQEQLDQMLAPLALYPDDLLSQVLMACTYPLEIVQADRWAKGNAELKGDEASKALEEEDWDPSVKSLVAVPDILALLSEKLEWTQQVGDAFMAQQKQVLDTIQALRAKAKEAGNLETTADQTVDVSGSGSSQTIIIESSSTEVIYVPVYDYSVCYGHWPYPAYPPYCYYPPHWRVGVAIGIGFAWGYAWGHCDWHGGDVDIDINRNIDRNRTIDRDRYAKDSKINGGKGRWQHDPSHRDSVAYRDNATAKRFGGVSEKQATAARDAYRGRADSGGAGLGSGSGRSGGGAVATRPSPNVGAGAGAHPATGGARAGVGVNAGTSGSRVPGTTPRGTSGTRTGALDGVNRSGAAIRGDSARGQSSRAGAIPRGGSMRGGRGGGGRR